MLHFQYLTFILSACLSTSLLIFFVYHLVQAQYLWGIVSIVSDERHYEESEDEALKSLFRPYLSCLITGAAFCLVQSFASMFGIFSSYTRRHNGANMASIVVALFAIGTASDLLYLARSVDVIRQNQDSVLLEYFSMDEKFLNQLENLFSCCGIQARDGFVIYPSLENEFCRPDEGFTSKPHPHCNYTIGEYVMKTDLALIALGLLTIILLTVSLFVYQSTIRCLIERASVKSRPIPLQVPLLQYSGKDDQMSA